MESDAGFCVMRQALQNHLADGGAVYMVQLRVGTNSEDGFELCKSDQREWNRLRKRLQHSGAKYRWFNTLNPEGASRVIFASVPLADGQLPLDNPEGTLLGAIRSVTSMGEPFKRRPAHGSPDADWQPKQVRNGEWVTVGTRASAVLLEDRQDAYDEAAAVANGVRTWRAE